MHEWMSDNRLTPLIAIDTTRAAVSVPSGHVRDGRIVLNISHDATARLTLANDRITFTARFNGTPFEVEVPVTAVLGIYARETGDGMVFTDGEGQPDPDDGGGDDAGRPSLKVVK